MIFGTSRAEIEKEYDKKYKEYANLLNTPNVQSWEKNAIKSELKHLELQMQQIKGSNEKKREDELNSKKKRKDEINIKHYRDFKNKYKKVSNFQMAINHLNNAIKQYQEPTYTSTAEKDKVIIKAM